uniref:Sodium ion channel toxin n=1 Tax=Edwardsia elegans TaxID=132404 RepID=A0A4Y5RX10_9CNID|nr:sodium ion channel toxin [Edwardsia elegans]QDA01865.1 sodium ion channel toxin [Edwardsia elegans]
MNSFLKVHAVVCLVLLVGCSSGRFVTPDDADTEYSSEYALAKRGAPCVCEKGDKTGIYWVAGCSTGWSNCKKYFMGNCCVTAG